MGFVRLCVERPIATILLTLAIVFGGLFGYRQLAVSALPEVELPTIQIEASLPGANPGIMAASVATPIERQLSTVAGIEQVLSSSSNGSTQITVQFALDRDIDSAALDVQSVLSAVTRRLPPEMPSPPSFRKINPADAPVIILAVRDKTRALNDLQTLVDNLLVPRISTLPGVGQVQTFGDRRFAVRIQFDPAALAARNLTVDDLRRGIALIMSGWRGFYTWLGREGLVASNPAQDLRVPKAPKPLPKAMGVDDAVQFADFASDDDPWLEARDAAMVELLYGSGLRVAELTGLDVVASPQAKGWIDMQAAQAHVLGKGSKRRSVPVGSSALLALERWLSQRGQSSAHGPVPVPAQEADAANALFTGRYGTRLTPQSVWQRLQRRSRQAGLAAPVHPHMLRHSFASHVLQSSGDLRAVQELLGHANISTTQVYTRLDFQHLAKAYDAAHPRAHLAGKPSPARKSPDKA